MAHFRSLAVLTLVSTVVPVIVACGSDPPPAPRTAPTSTATTPPAPTAPASASAASSASTSASPSASTPSADGVPADALGLGDIGTLGTSGGPSKPPKKRSELGHGTTTTSGSGNLPVEVIDRIVRQQYGRFRLCYEKGLESDPTLAGKVTAKLVIDASGAVSSATDGGSDLKDAKTTSCILRSFMNATFPSPAGGTVTVSYPLTLAPGT